MQSGLAAWRRNPFLILVLLRPRNNPQVTNYLSPPSVFPTVSKGVDETLVTAPPALTLDSTKCQVLPVSVTRGPAARQQELGDCLFQGCRCQAHVSASLFTQQKSLRLSGALHGACQGLRPTMPCAVTTTPGQREGA